MRVKGVEDGKDVVEVGEEDGGGGFCVCGATSGCILECRDTPFKVRRLLNRHRGGTCAADSQCRIRTHGANELATQGGIVQARFLGDPSLVFHVMQSSPETVNPETLVRIRYGDRRMFCGQGLSLGS